MSEQPGQDDTGRDDETGTSLPGMIADAGREAGSDDDGGTGGSGLTTDDGTPVGQADVEADAERSGADRSGADPGVV